MSRLSFSIRNCMLPALVAAAMSSSAWAGTVASRAALDTLLGAGGTRENFEKYPVANGGVANIDPTLSSTSTPNGQGPGLVAAGMTFKTSSGVLAWQGNGAFGGLPTKTLGADTAFDITIDFTAFTNTVGVDLLNYPGGAATYAVTVYGLDDTTVLQSFPSILFPSAVTTRFFGFESAGGIGSIRVDAVQGFGPILDNLSFGTVPEPGSMGLVAMSLMALRVSRPGRASLHR